MKRTKELARAKREHAAALAAWRELAEREGDQQAAKWLQLTAAARLAGVSRTSFHLAAAAGELPYATIGRERFFAFDDVVAWAARRSNRPAGDTTMGGAK
jgi:hypothetical protein